MLNMKSACAILVLLVACLPACPQALAGIAEDEKALSAATHALCHAHVAMLGESATHGDGHTLAFKVALVERLVDQCGFRSVFFEANQDEFIHLNHRIHSGQTSTPDDVLTAVGGLWKFYREFQPLAPFLLARAQSHRIVLGGLDDQLAQLGQDYANDGMLVELTDLLPDLERQTCSTALHKRVTYDYPASAPYSRADRTQIETCLAHIQTASTTNTSIKNEDREDREEQLEMISAAQRWVSRDFTSDAEAMVNRDRSMFQTLEWLQRRLPKRQKTIIWAATVHIAKHADPTWGDHSGTNFGSFLHQEYGNRAASLGFSALTGSFRQGKGNFPAMPASPPDSIEARALHGTDADASYVGSAELNTVRTAPGAFFRHSYQMLHWSDFLDGVVVFRAEYPPPDTRVR